MIEDLKQITRGQAIGLLAFFLVMLGCIVAVSASQQKSFEEAQAAQAGMVYIQDTEGRIRAIPEKDYIAANEQWERDHPEDYGFFDHMVECETPSDGDVD